MSLRDLGIFNPLTADHPLVRDGYHCGKCTRPFEVGMRTALMSVETPEQAGSLTVRALPVCATCALLGQRVMTPDGPRVVAYVKDGDVPYPIETFGEEVDVHHGWLDEQVGPA